MDGKNLRFVGDILANNFHVDKYGSYIPSSDNLHMEVVQRRIARQLKADTGLRRRMAEMYWRTDVDFTHNPLGNTPVIGAGIKLFGSRPLDKLKFEGKMTVLAGKSKEKKAELDKRERRIEQFQKEILSCHENLKPADDDKRLKLLWDVEGDQAMTGGGFDNNAVGEVQKSALNFITKSNSSTEYEDSVLSKYVVEGCLWLANYLEASGLRRGSIEPVGASVVRFEQDNDGMIGYPVYAKGNSPLTSDIALRLLLEFGVDTREFVNSSVKDRSSGVEYKYRVIDAIGYVLDNSALSDTDICSVVTLLARIQKHGWKKDGNGFIAKPGKTRSVYPNAAIPGVIEAMIMSPFNQELQKLKVSFMPSLQNKETRVSMLTNMIREASSKGYDYLAADWSKYDATVKGSILATVIQYCVKPFINAKYHSWIDAATYILTYKYLVCDTALCKINNDEFEEAKKSGKYVDVDTYTVFGLVDGLISGAKFTHVGGSMYGEVAIHYVIPKLLGYEPIIGAQAGDDTLMGIPKTMIYPADQEGTYTPIQEAASKLGLDINPGKQIWHQQDGEIVKVFLQEVYHEATDIWGIGSAFRPISAIFFSERNKGLSIGEQFMAEIARMNQGYDCPFIDDVVRFWLSKEQFLGILFKERGASEAFNTIVQSVGTSIDELVQRIEVGSFTFGIGKDQVQTGAIPILAVMERVASKETYSVSLSTALKALNVQAGGGKETTFSSDDIDTQESSDVDGD